MEPAITKSIEHLVQSRMPGRLLLVIIFKILLADIGRLAIFGQQMVKWLVTPGPAFLGNGVPPVFTIGEFRINIENHPAKRQEPVAYYIADTEACNYGFRAGHHGVSADFDPVVFHFPVRLPMQGDMGRHWLTVDIVRLT